MFTLQARDAFTYRGRTFAAGERFDVNAIDAAILTYRRAATFAAGPAAGASGPGEDRPAAPARPAPARGRGRPRKPRAADSGAED